MISYNIRPSSSQNQNLRSLNTAWKKYCMTEKEKRICFQGLQSQICQRICIRYVGENKRPMIDGKQVETPIAMRSIFNIFY